MRVISIDVVEDFRLKYKERSVDPSFFGLRFLRELDNFIPLHFKVSKARRGPYSGQCCQLTVASVKRQQIL